MTLILNRIDDRLIHGQVVVGWGQPFDVRFIVLVDDAVARITAVTIGDVVRVGRSLLTPEAAALAAVGPFEDESTFTGVF